jgi:hypothetical protein
VLEQRRADIKLDDLMQTDREIDQSCHIWNRNMRRGLKRKNQLHCVEFYDVVCGLISCCDIGLSML